MVIVKCEESPPVTIEPSRIVKVASRHLSIQCGAVAYGSGLNDGTKKGDGGDIVPSKIIESNRRVTMSNLREGTSNTYMIGECNAGFLPWGRMGNTRNHGLGIRQDWNGATIGNVGYGPVAGHRSALFAMCDASIRTVGVRIDSSVLIAMDSDPLE